MQSVIVTTIHKGVFFGQTDDSSGSTINLKECRMAIYWGTTKGVMELAATGPTDKSRIGAACDAEIRDVTAVFNCSDEAAEKWLNS